MCVGQNIIYIFVQLISETENEPQSSIKIKMKTNKTGTSTTTSTTMCENNTTANQVAQKEQPGSVSI